MRWIAVLGLVLASGIVFAGEVTLDVVAGGLKGKATLVNKLLPNGSKYVRLGMVLEDEAKKSVSVLQESTYDTTGLPIRHLQVTNLQGGSAKQSVVVTFDTAGANIKVEQDGKAVNDVLAFPSGLKATATPEFWFIRDQVAAGGKTTYQRFDLGTRTWQETVCIFHGKRNLKWAGKTVSTNYVTIGTAKAWLDDVGDPYLIETPGGSMTRRAGK
ncbi:MAG: hypothetical protein KF824_11330 [Fimbriimonadaceae bacterium]|nr:MAG: hypothetical protein KF824_11330 [Fimbriimonadaceae bacterium]